MQVIHSDALDAHRQRRDAYEQARELGDCHVAMGNWDEARRCYQQAAVLAPQQPEPHVGLGAVAMQLGRDDEALRAFHAARRLDGQCLPAHAGAAMIYQQQSRHPQAFEMYLRCLELDPDDLNALLGLFQASCQMGTFAKIIHYLELYLRNHPDDPAVLFCLASLYARENLNIQAKEALLTVLACDPDTPQAHELLADIEDRLLHERTQEVA
ncbi:MAG: tetratricopeptide repeat protein [Planctomycetes bacterium]|nr:tetratricopeptide repeat protein [Planctomycetota bacterium]